MPIGVFARDVLERQRLSKVNKTDMAKDTTGRLHVTVKTGGKRKLSSKLWLERQLNDPYVAQAKRDGLRSRAAYKLIEIDDKYHFLKSGITVVDLGAAPGGWSQIAAKRIGAANGKGKVVAIDLLEMPEIPGVIFAQLDFLKEDAPDRLLKMLGGRADVVLSDMAANTTGHRKTDQLRILGLVETAVAFAAEVLNPGGTLVAKVFQSGADAELMTELKRDFATVKHVKPASSRKDSSERYVLAMGFRGVRADRREPSETPSS
jgi:23S rRNA (uridine2552-2'-O)-methyltransferase